MKARQQYPQDAQQAYDQQRVVDPQPAAHIIQHTNVCSPEQAFAHKDTGGTNTLRL